jgi:16S rRNA processing protein RimM
MGRIVAPFGVKGWVKIQPFTATTESLLAYPTWWIGHHGDWREHEVSVARTQGRAVLALLEGCGQREAAAALRGSEVAVPREQLPQTQANEYYWADLIGLSVVDNAEREFGRVTDILHTGANDVLVVAGSRERLIPFITNVIREVDLAAGVIRVDWGADY